MQPVLYLQQQFRIRKFIDAGYTYIQDRVERAEGIICCCNLEDLPEEVDFFQRLKEGNTLFVPFAVCREHGIDAADGTVLPLPEGVEDPSDIQDENLRKGWEPIHRSDTGCMGFLIRWQGNAVEIQSGIYDEGDFVTGRVVKPRGDMGILEQQMVEFVGGFLRNTEEETPGTDD